ncbi:MAG: hypothetical protein FWG89_07280 [Treponema sp.]|nr:hypothetical protein [Treponema sp.]
MKKPVFILIFSFMAMVLSFVLFSACETTPQSQPEITPTIPPRPSVTPTAPLPRRVVPSRIPRQEETPVTPDPEPEIAEQTEVEEETPSVEQQETEMQAEPAELFTANAKIGFSTVFGYEHRFSTNDMELASAGLGFKASLDFIAFFSPNFYLSSEIVLAETNSLNNLYDRHSNLTFADGWRRLGSDLFSSPLYYFSSDGPNGESSIGVGNVHLVLGSPWVEVELGYGQAKLPTHRIANWLTIDDDDWDAGYLGTGGFSVIRLGEKLQQAGPLTINASIGPNRTADRAGTQYGFFSFLTAEMYNQLIGFQYNGAYGFEFDKIFEEIYEADLIFGYEGRFGPFGVKTNFLWNSWGAQRALFVLPDGTLIEIREYYSPSYSDVLWAEPDADAINNMAFALRGEYTADIFDVAAGYRFRGAQANMMYIKEDGNDTHLSDQLGIRNTQRLYLYGGMRPNETLSFGAELGVDFLFTPDGTWLPYYDNSNKEFYLKPNISYDLSDILGLESSVSAYAEFTVNTADDDRYIRGNTVSNFVIPVIGLKFETGALNNTFRGFELHYGFDNQDEKFLYNSVLGTIKFPWNLDAQLGFMVRTPHKGVDKDNPYEMAIPPPQEVDYTLTGFSVGAVKRFREERGPAVFSQFIWNMDPYQSFNDGQSQFDLDGSLPSRGVAENNNGYAALRFGLSWEF